MARKLTNHSMLRDMLINNLLFTEVEVNSGGYLPSHEVVREISTTFTNTEVYTKTIVIIVLVYTTQVE